MSDYGFSAVKSGVREREIESGPAGLLSRLSEVGKNLEELNKIILTLGDRLTPVLFPPFGSAINDTEKRPAQPDAPTCETVERVNEQVIVATQRMQEIIRYLRL